MPPSVWLLAIVGSLLLVAVHALTPLLESSSRRNQTFFASVEGGVSLSYVVLYLLFRLVRYGSPEIHRLLPLGPDALETMFMVLLLALTVAYVLQIHSLRRPGCAPSYVGTAAFLVLYNLLAGAALLEEAQRGWLKLGLYVMAIGLHLLINDHFLARMCPGSHRGAWRGALAIAPLIGCLIALALAVPSGVLYLLLTVVAGVTIINTFRKELPLPEAYHFAGFLGGVLFYAFLILATWQP